MNNRGTGFLAVVLFGSFFLPSTHSLQQVVSLSQSLSVVTHRDYWREEVGGGEGEGKEEQESLVLYSLLTTLWWWPFFLLTMAI
jgi:hypothetical protein